MKAVILAATRSERLNPFTATQAKPMIRIAGKYILESTIQSLKEAGIADILLVVNHQKDSIKNYFSYGDKYGVNIQYVVQDPINGIGGALKLCQPFLGSQEHFLLVYGDVLSNGNIFSNVLRTYSETGKDVAVVTLPQSSKEYGNVYLDHEMKIRKLIEKPSERRRSNYVFSGVYALSQKIFELLDAHQNDMEQCYQSLIQDNGLQASLWEKGWMDIIYPWHILEANKMVMDTWKEARIDASVVIRGNVQIEGPVHIESKVKIESGAVIKGPCFIGENSYIGNNVLIRDYSAVGPKSVVGFGSELKNCVIFGEASIGRLSYIGDSVIGYGANLQSGLTTVNHHQDFSNVICKINGETLDTGLNKVGAFIGDNVVIGSRHTLGPGTLISANTFVPDNISLK